MTAIQTRVGEGITQISLRMPVELHRNMKEIAGRRGQSLNTAIVMILRKEVAEEATAQQ